MTPKQLLLALPLLCLAATATAQTTSFTAGINSGIFRYHGDQAFEKSGINPFPTLRTSVDGTAGTSPGFSFEITADIRRVTRYRMLIGAEVAFQSLQSRTEVSSISPTLYSSFFMPAAGTTKLTAQFISLTPFIGYRFLDKKLKLDLTTGLELAACISKKEQIDAHHAETGEEFAGTSNVPRRPDHRIRLQVNTSFGRFGLTTGYAIGLENFYRGEDYTAYSGFIRLGFTCRIR